MQLRLAKESDFNEIYLLYKNALKEKYCVWSESYPSFLDIETDFKFNNLFVYEIDNKIIGAVSILYENELNEFCHWEYTNNIVEIARVVVHHEYHGKGIAKEMILQLFKICQERGYQAMHLACQCDNLPAIRTYQKLNFKFLGELFIFENNYFMCEYIF